MFSGSSLKIELTLCPKKCLFLKTDTDGKPGMWEHLRVEYSSFLMILMSWDDLSDPYPPKYTQNTASPNQLSARKLMHKMSLIFKEGGFSYAEPRQKSFFRRALHTVRLSRNGSKGVVVV